MGPYALMTRHSGKTYKEERLEKERKLNQNYSKEILFWMENTTFTETKLFIENYSEEKDEIYNFTSCISRRRSPGTFSPPTLQQRMSL